MISFVVPAYNEAQLLGRTLDAIHAAARESGRPYEVLVVDDASTDETAAIAAAHGARVVPVAFRQISRTRNAGARAAAGTVLVFVDADTVINAAVVRGSLDALEGGAVGGGTTIRFDGVLPAWAVVALPVLGVAMRLGRLAAGCYVFCMRDAFVRVGGFDETLYAGEEIMFSVALRRVGRVVILGHEISTSGRKLRSHSGWEILRLLSAFARHGFGAVRSREGLEIWYKQR